MGEAVVIVINIIFFFCSCLDAVPCEENMNKVKVKRMNQLDESIDIYTEFFKPYELTSFDDTFCIAMTNSARWIYTYKSNDFGSETCL